jgi:hypothetical protein
VLIQILNDIISTKFFKKKFHHQNKKEKTNRDFAGILFRAGNVVYRSVAMRESSQASGGGSIAEDPSSVKMIDPWGIIRRFYSKKWVIKITTLP